MATSPPEKSRPNSVRLGIIGLGNIGRHHAGYVIEGKVPRCELAAVCSRKTDLPAEFKSVAVFDDAEKLMRSGLVDAVLLATPHGQHPREGMAAFEAGLHVMAEKPIASHKADAERFIAAWRRSVASAILADMESGILPGGKATESGTSLANQEAVGASGINPGGRMPPSTSGKMPDATRCVFAVMSQFRVEPRYQKMREMIQSGALGQLVRVSWINTDWFRPEAYYQSSAWRATWRGEGGGVLINQCLHNLDMLQWLVGMPSRVRGFCQFGRFHDIEVEDDVTAYFEWANGATGTFVSSTGEAPGTNRLEISGTRGRLLLENGKLCFTQNERDAREFSRSAEQAFSKLAGATQEIPFENAAQPHAELLRNFVNAILDGEALLAPGAEGINSVELANAIVYSSLLEQTVALPLDGAAWEAKLSELIAGSRVKKVVRAVTGDVASSFKR